MSAAFEKSRLAYLVPLLKNAVDTVCIYDINILGVKTPQQTPQTPALAGWPVTRLRSRPSRLRCPLLVGCPGSGQRKNVTVQSQTPNPADNSVFKLRPPPSTSETPQAVGTGKIPSQVRERCLITGAYWRNSLLRRQIERLIPVVSAQCSHSGHESTASEVIAGWTSVQPGKQASRLHLELHRPAHSGLKHLIQDL